ncbi:DUF3563 family protein [Paraburkholderia sp. Ac-20347]|jgi:hypothetical protein|uniref:DUF3563 family protein n=1 Tax=Paraburkholderia sp. Ac-20347 TaxID=2703892 RepID=UPI00197DAAE1|nr:DUF3563 family protein [Paraburkholderia sp. Ac-20347]MBN3807991.1 DUF3563 domain-containing protein [Paraburkholderia sp. Ac-20347]
MYLISRLFLFLTKSAETSRKEREEAYLSESADIYDLEFRMRKLDREKAGRQPSWMNHYG